MLETAQIVREGLVATGPQPPGQAAVDHVALDRREGDAGVIVDQRSDLLEVSYNFV